MIEIIEVESLDNLNETFNCKIKILESNIEIDFYLDLNEYNNNEVNFEEYNDIVMKIFDVSNNLIENDEGAMILDPSTDVKTLKINKTINFIPFDETKAKEREKNILASLVKHERNMKLKEADIEFNKALEQGLNHTAWGLYRQELRDLTTQPGFPYDVVWPTKPSFM